MKRIIHIILAVAGVHTAAIAQPSSKVTVSGYLEAYNGFDINRPEDHNRPGFVYSHHRHNEVNLNLGFIKANYTDERARANLALMAGTYANANLAAEPGVLKNVFEANAGVKLSKTTSLWLDAGIFTSHIGFESAISKDCWVLTRNIVSDNTPYYESGAKLTYTSDNGQWAISGLYLNGWQRIARTDASNNPTGGLQFTYKPSGKVTLNYSNYLGTEGPDSTGITRLYHNLYGIFQFTDKFGLIAGIDYGTQQKAKGSDDRSSVIAPVLIARYTFNEHWAMAGRLEYYEDEDGMIISVAPRPFKTTGCSMNIDYSPVPNAVFRLEGKLWNSKDAVFAKSGNPTDQNGAITASIALSF